MRAIVLGLLLLAVSSRAYAQAPPNNGPPPVETLYDEGKRHYTLAEYDQAIAKFKAAYNLLPNPGFLYNIAQSYRHKKDCGQALTFYRNYLREDPQARNRVVVERHIEAMEACLAKEREEPPPVDHRPGPTPRPVAGPIPPVASPPVAKGDDGAGPRPGGTRKLLGLIGAGVGLATVATGAYFSSVASDKSGELEQACASGCTFDDPVLQALDRDGKAAASSATTLYVAGGATVLAGASIYLWGALVARDDRSSRVALVPQRGGLAVSAAWSF